MTAVDFWVPGVPQPKGSLRHVGGGRLIESAKGLADWRRAIADAAWTYRLEHAPYPGAVAVWLDFYLPRPLLHFRGNNRDGELRPTAPARPKVRPDTDKLARAVLDAIQDSGAIYKDDAQVAELVSRKHYADARIPGARIRVVPCCLTCGMSCGPTFYPYCDRHERSYH